MQKEKLTKNIIINELLSRRKNNLLTFFLIALLMFCFLFMPTLFVMGLFTNARVSSLTAVILSVTISLICYIVDGKGNRKIKSGKFHVVEDKLVGLREKEGTSKRSGRSFNYYRPTLFVFASYGEFELSDAVDIYKWSKEFRMSDTGLYHMSSTDDIFYIVTFDKQKILYIYPKKFFDYTEN